MFTIEYLVVFVVLMICELFYFKLADKYNIIDKPNLRSSHDSITLRGGGIIFFIAVLVFFIFKGNQYPSFFWGLSLLALVSFVDDVITLSNKVRLLVHFSSVWLLAYQLDVFDLGWVFLFVSFVLIVGVINAYNFMDGINGITVANSVAVILLLIIVNWKVDFIDTNLLYYVLISLMVFGFFNFRNKAKAFAGDIGSVSIAYIIIFALGALIIKTGNLIYILFLLVYGIDTVWTIIFRLCKKENIFEAHRTHLYQFLANEAGVNRLVVSFLYGFTQLLVGLMVVWIVERYEANVQSIFAGGLILIFSLTYLLIKRRIFKKYSLK